LNFKGADKLQVSELRPAPKPSKAEIKALTALEASHIRVLPVATTWAAMKRISGTGGQPRRRGLGADRHVVSLIHLNLAGTKVTDASLVYLRGLKNLTRLHLEKTRVTDAGLANLRGLTELTYLNLYGTAITDAGSSVSMV